MKLRGTLTQLGLSWLDRLLPTFEKLTTTGSQHRLITLYFNPTQMSLVVRPGEDFGSVDAHADVRISSTSTTTTNNNENNEEEEEEEEIFERKSYVCTSIARDQIAFKVDANGLSRVVKGLVHVNATGARVKLLRRERRRKEENTTTNDNNNNEDYRRSAGFRVRPRVYYAGGPPWASQNEFGLQSNIFLLSSFDALGYLPRTPLKGPSRDQPRLPFFTHLSDTAAMFIELFHMIETLVTV